MKVKVKMPKIGDGEGPYELEEWNVAAGDSVAAGDILCTVEVSKATTDVISEFTGTVVEILVEEGEELNPRDFLCIIDAVG